MDPITSVTSSVDNHINNKITYTIHKIKPTQKHAPNITFTGSHSDSESFTAGRRLHICKQTQKVKQDHTRQRKTTFDADPQQSPAQSRVQPQPCQSSEPFPHAQQFFSGAFQSDSDSELFPMFSNIIFLSLQIGTPVCLNMITVICSHVKDFSCLDVVQSGVSLHVETSPLAFTHESSQCSHPHFAKLEQSSDPASAAVLKYKELVVDKKKQPFGPQDNSLICRAEVFCHPNLETALAQANAVWIGFLHLPFVN